MTRRMLTLCCGAALVAFTLTPASAQITNVSVADTDAAGLPLFDFMTPAAFAPGHVVYARFVTDDTATDLGFYLDTGIGSAYNDSQVFTISGGNQPVADADGGPDPLDCRVWDVTNGPPSGVNAVPTGGAYRVLRFRCRFLDDTFPDTPETWTVYANPPPAAAAAYKFWGFKAEGVGDATVDAQVSRPYLIEYIEDSGGNPDVTKFGSYVDLPATTNFSFGTVHVNSSDAFAISQPYDFINVGTAALEITGVAETSGGSNVNLPHAGYSAEGYFTTPSSVLPAAALTGTVFKFNPTTTGSAANVNIDVTVNSTAIPLLEVNLTGGHGIRLKTAILMDRSGSMDDDVHGDSTTLESEQKMYKARDAARYFVDVYKQNVPEAEIGLTVYPGLEEGRSDGCWDAQQLVNYDEAQNAATFSALHDERLSRNHSSRLQPGEATPMVSGLQTVLDSMGSAQTDTERLVLMVGDGQSYCLDGAPDPSTMESALTNSGVTFHTVPYGDDEEDWTDQLKDIASWTGGDSYPVNVLEEDDLKKEAENVLRDVIGLETVTDPSGSIQRSQVVRDKVCVPEDEYVLNFLVRWENEEVGAITASLEAPDGTRIDKNTAMSRPDDVGYFETESFIGYTVRGDFLAGRNGVGDWWLELTGTNRIGAEDSVDFNYSVYSQSTLKTGYEIGPWFVGELSALQFLIADGTHPVRSFESTTLQFRAPTESFGTWLATTHVDPARVVKVPDDAPGTPISLADKKYWLLKNELQQPFDPGWKVHRVELGSANGRDVTKALAAKQAVASGSGLTAQLPEAIATGRYEFRAVLEGLTLGGDCFEREISWVQDVRIRFTADLILKYMRVVPIEVTPLFPPELVDLLQSEPPDGRIRSGLEVTPRTDQDIYAGPGYGDRIEVEIEGGEILAPYIDQLDGSFLYLIEHPAGSDPQLKVTVDGVVTPMVHLSDVGGQQTASRGCLFWLLIVLVLLIIVVLVLRR